eukprot:SAG11_NODE_3129_length_2665_cov_1.658613_1_plen_76_part_00
MLYREFPLQPAHVSDVCEGRTAAYGFASHAAVCRSVPWIRLARQQWRLSTSEDEAEKVDHSRTLRHVEFLPGTGQ